MLQSLWTSIFSSLWKWLASQEILKKLKSNTWLEQWHLVTSSSHRHERKSFVHFRPSSDLNPQSRFKSFFWLNRREPNKIRVLVIHTCFFTYQGYQGTLVLKLSLASEYLVAVTGTTESTSPLNRNQKNKKKHHWLTFRRKISQQY